MGKESIHNTHVGIEKVFNEKLRLYDYKHYPYGKIRDLFEHELYQFQFNFIHFHIMEDSINSLMAEGGYERISIPFALNVVQQGLNGFKLGLVAHDDFIDQEKLYLLGAGTRYKVSKRLSVNLEYASRLNLNRNTRSAFRDPISIGLDIETGGHVFQMVFSNTQPMNDVALFSNAGGNWEKGSVYFGFNMYRVF